MFSRYFCCLQLYMNKGNNKSTEHRAIFQRERQNSYANKQTQSVNNRKTGKTAMALTWYKHFQRNLADKNYIINIFHHYLSLLLRCCSVWLSETGQHMPLICVYCSHVVLFSWFFCVIQQPPYLKQIMQYCQVIHILSNRIDPGSKNYN
jgi:hypothetical protein